MRTNFIGLGSPVTLSSADKIVINTKLAINTFSGIDGFMNDIFSYVVEKIINFLTVASYNIAVTPKYDNRLLDISIVLSTEKNIY